MVERSTKTPTPRYFVERHHNALKDREMPRVRLQEQEHYPFRYDTAVQPRDVNLTGHLDHKAIVEIVHDARANVLYSFGIREHDLGDGRTGIIMGDLVVNYKKEAFAFEKLRVDVHFEEIGPKGFRMFFRIRERQGDSLVALAEAGFVIYDYATRTVSPMPEAFRNAVALGANSPATTPGDCGQRDDAAIAFSGHD